jgi:hypothetical protein
VQPDTQARTCASSLIDKVLHASAVGEGQAQAILVHHVQVFSIISRVLSQTGTPHMALAWATAKVENTAVASLLLRVPDTLLVNVMATFHAEEVLSARSDLELLDAWLLGRVHGSAIDFSELHLGQEVPPDAQICRDHLTSQEAQQRLAGAAVLQRLAAVAPGLKHITLPDMCLVTYETLQGVAKALLHLTCLTSVYVCCEPTKKHRSLEIAEAIARP